MRPDMQPYKGKLAEKTWILCFFINPSHLKTGSPMTMPRALASLERAITQPSLLDKTITGLF